MNFLPNSIGYITWNLAWNCLVDKCCSVYNKILTKITPQSSIHHFNGRFEAMMHLTEKSQYGVKRENIRTSSTSLFAQWSEARANLF